MKVPTFVAILIIKIEENIAKRSDDTSHSPWFANIADSDGLDFHVHVNPNGEKLENKKEERTAATHNRTGWESEKRKSQEKNRDILQYE